MGDGMLALTWNNHSSTFSKTISTLRLKEQYTDVTITCEGKFYQVHKFVLATCSDYFEKIFQETPCKHPVVVLRDVSCDELEALLNYMYIGSVSVARNDLSRLIKVAELFQIKGLAVPDDPPKVGDGKLDNANSKNRDRGESYYASLGADSSTTSPYTTRSKTNRSVGDTYSPCPKRMRSHDSPSVTETHHSRGGNLQNKSDTHSNSSSNDQFPPYGVVKDEVHNVIDSGSESQDGSIQGSLIPKKEVIGLQEDENFVKDDSHIALPYLTSAEGQDLPPDGQPAAPPVLGQHSFNEELLSLPGPSDAQEWYSEGDASGGDGSQEMLSMDASQQSQRMEVKKVTSQPIPGKEALARLHKCSICSYISPNKTNYQNHLKVHTGEKPYLCGYCPARFSQKSNLKRHIYIHTGDKPFSCSKCDYKANQKSVLDCHYYSKHDAR